MNISEDLKKQAIGFGLCEDWTNEWANPSKDELLKKYVRGIDFCIEHNYPSCYYMKDNFDGIMQKYGVFVDDVVDGKNYNELICNGKTTGKVVYDNYNVCNWMYLRHDSDMEIEVTENAYVTIHLYDNAKLKVRNTSTRRVVVFRHGGTVNYSGNVVVKERKAPN